MKKNIKYISLGLLLLVCICIFTMIKFVTHPSFGRLPQGERLERIKLSPNYRDGIFHNLTTVPTTEKHKKSKILSLFKFIFKKDNIEGLRPAKPVITSKTDIHSLDLSKDIAIWLGHSSLYLQVNKTKILVDPVLISASPISYFNKAFKGSDIYKPIDIPEIDYLITTHDHWDHLDYNTIIQVMGRVKKFICSLGVGEHLEYWGANKNDIIELDWHESYKLRNNLTITSTPARHFSGRGLSNQNTTLWSSYILETPIGNIFLSGDTGYDSHFKKIKDKFGNIKIAFIENGQYDKQWQHIHLMPKDFIKAVIDIAPDTLIGIHNSKYAMAKHKWDEPLHNALAAAKENNFNLLTPMIGQIISLTESNNSFTNWWDKSL